MALSSVLLCRVCDNLTLKSAQRDKKEHTKSTHHENTQDLIVIEKKIQKKVGVAYTCPITACPAGGAPPPFTGQLVLMDRK